jgi:D-sedoheptulose 7-phosphate isomerase
MSFSERHLQEARQIIDAIDVAPIERMVAILVQVRDAGGRLFFLGVGGSAGNCGHAVNDFRKIVGIEAYAPTDNVSELTARTNDEGWETVFVEWLKTSRLRPTDALFIFSVTAAATSKRTSVPIWFVHCSMPKRLEQGCSVSSVGMGVTRQKSATPSRLCQRLIPRL